MENSEPQDVNRPDPGGMLRQAREAQNISQREMADRLNWMPAYISAVEANEFDVIRGAAFVRGYLRAYAKQVNLAETELLAAYEAMPSVAAAPDKSERRIESRIPPQLQKHGWALPAGIGIVLCLLLLMWLFQGDEEVSAGATAPAVVVDAPAVEVAAVIDEEPSETALILDSQTEVVMAIEEPAIETVVEIPSPEETISTPEFIDTSVVVTGEEALQPQNYVAGSEQGELLEFSFSGECWLEVRDGLDQLIYADLRQDGDSLELRGQPPFNILVGDSRFVALQYEGAVVEIKPRPGRVIARTTVGES